MPKPPPKFRPRSSPVIEHARVSGGRNFTAWHHLLAQVLQRTETPSLKVHCFVRLGTLPLEADVIILRLADHADIELLAEHFGFLVPALRRYLIIEYKSPEDRLTLDDFDTVRAYAMLCKRKYAVVHDEEIAVAMLYSQHETHFFDGCARNSFPFVDSPHPGVRQCCQHAMAFYAMDLVALGQQRPQHPLNLLSILGLTYDPAGLQADLGPFSVLYEEVFLKELKKMGQMQVPGSQTLTQRVKDQILAECSAEERLRGLKITQQAKAMILAECSAEERLRGLQMTQQAKAMILAECSAEERLRGLQTTQQAKAMILAECSAEERLRGLPAEERLRGLSKAELARLRKLLLK